MSETKYGHINGQPIDPGEGWKMLSVVDRLNRNMDMFTHDGENWEWFNALWNDYEVGFILLHNASVLAFRRPITVKPALPFPIDPAFDYIVTPGDRERFAPKLATDELYFTGAQVWRFASNNGTFGDSCIYRRRKAKEATGWGSVDYDHALRNATNELTQLRATIDDHVAKALITNHIIKLSAEEVTRLHAIIDAQAGEAESLKLQNAGLHTEFIRMAQQIAVLGGDKYSLQSTIDAQKKVIEKLSGSHQERDNEWGRIVADLESVIKATADAFNKYGQIEFFYLKDKALAAIRKLEEGK